ncbi:MAG: helix-turn-helix domain-containing protein [Kiritimatiellae bacterium]|nr:helix-turn-helix domain-containing protein [Kiritimatiellia bacterium]
MQKRTIGVVLESDVEYGVAVFEGIRAALDKLPEWEVVPVTQAQQGLLSRLLEARRLDGIIAPVMSDRWVQSQGAPVAALVNISNISRVETLSSAVVDDRMAGVLVARHFAEMGLARAGVVFERAVHASVLRKEGFCASLAEHGVQVELPTVPGGYSYEVEWEHWLRGVKGEMALFGTSDRVVRRFMNLYRRLQGELQVRVGAVAGVGDSLVERALSGIDLSSVVLPAAAVGRAAVGLMQRLLDGDRRPVRCEVAPVELIVRRSSAAGRTGDELVVKALGYIDRMIGVRFSVDELAVFAGASRRKLEMRFQGELGVAPAAYIREQRRVLAERLLTESTLTIREIAARCGAGSPQAFTTQFKELHGVPPAAFRAGGKR